MNNLIIGGCYGYEFNQIKYWINSLNRCGFEGDKVLILFGNPTDLNQKIEEQGVKVFNYAYDGNVAPHVQRFLAIYDYLTKNEYDNVITTDVRDVIFQRDPFEWLEQHSYPKIVAASECLKYKDEPWGNQNLHEAYGGYIHQLYKNNTIYNVGVFGGQYRAVRDMCLNIAINSINREIKICDQAVFNVTIYNDIYKNDMIFADVKDLWAAHLGTLADPSKLAYFKPNFLENFTLEFKDDKLLINSIPVYIIHQYDRTHFKPALEKIYG